VVNLEVSKAKCLYHAFWKFRLIKYPLLKQAKARFLLWNIGAPKWAVLLAKASFEKVKVDLIRNEVVFLPFR